MRSLCFFSVRRLSAVLIACSAVPHSADGQADTLRIPYRPTCGSCVAAFFNVLSIGSMQDSVPLFPGHPPVRDGAGRFIALAHDRLEILSYDEAGKLKLSFGSVGQGPGEFRQQGVASVGVGPGDSVYVLADSRVLIFSPAGKFSRELRLPVVATLNSKIAPLRDGRFLVSGRGLSGTTHGFPVHIFAPNGQHVKSIGPEDRMSAINPPYQYRFVLSDDEKYVWTSFAHVSQQWALDGRLIETIVLDGVPGVKTQEFRGTSSRSGLPPPRGRLADSLLNEVTVLLLKHDLANLLWFELVYPARAVGGEVKLQLDVVDIRARQLLFSQPLVYPLRFFPGSEMAMQTRGSQDGIVFFQLVRSTLVR